MIVRKWLIGLGVVSLILYMSACATERTPQALDEGTQILENEMNPPANEP